MFLLMPRSVCFADGEEQVGVRLGDNGVRGMAARLVRVGVRENCTCGCIFFPLGVNDGNIDQAPQRFIFTSVSSAEIFPT